MTNILAIDTTLGACSAAIIVDGEVAAQGNEIRARGHVELLLPMIEEVRGRASIELSELDFIATTVGPGTFAGVRVGLSAAKGLGLALDLPVIPVTSLEAIACEFCAYNQNFLSEVAVAIDARRGEIYLQGYDIAEGRFKPKYEAQALTIKQALEKLGSEFGTIIGSGTNILTGNENIEMKQYHNPSAEFVGKAALERLQDAISCHDISPLYLRAPDAIKPAPFEIVVSDE